MQISIFKMLDSKMKRSHEIKATAATRNPRFTPSTATALCRGAFHAFPGTVRDKRYSIDLDAGTN
jgi:hypothetical protein